MVGFITLYSRLINGVAVWVDCPCEVLDVTLPDNLNSDVLVLRIKCHQIILIAVYHPYWGKVSAHSALLNTLDNVIDLHLKSGERIVFCGDVNDLRHYFNDFLISNNLIQLVNFSTRKNHTLDVLYISNITSSFSFSVEKLAPLGRSDHNVVFAKLNRKTVSRKKTFVRDFSPKNNAMFSEAINNVIWDDLFSSASSVNDLATCFDSCISDIFNQCYPQRSVYISTIDQPWMTPHIKYLMKLKNRAYHKGQVFNYQSIRDRLIKELKSSKSQYYKKMSNENVKKRWASVNKLINLPNSNLDFSQD